MKMIKDFLLSTFLFKLYGFLVVVALLLGGLTAAHAQTTLQFIPFWHADSFVPADFTGKVFPTEKTIVQASFELLRGGKFADLSGKRVVWLIGENIIGDGTNKKNVTFVNHAYGSSGIELDVNIFDINGQTLKNSFTIPATTPKLVIESPYDKNNLTKKNLNVAALPYFWNITNLQELIFSWAVNSVRPPEGASVPDKLSITIPDGTPAGTKITVDVSAQDQASGFETANDEIIYTIAP